MSIHVCVIGANGQLGTDVCESLDRAGHPVLGLTHEQIEITEYGVVREILATAGVDVVVNTAAMHHVGKCEEDPRQAFLVNGIGARNLALACRENQCVLVHISTDYVFDGEKKRPYVESDRPVPLNVYGNTKLSGEYFIESICEKFMILRVSGIYGRNPCRAKGSNFVQTMLKLAKERTEVRVVDDEILTPTFTGHIADQIVALLEGNYENGLYHVTAEGECSWYEFAGEIFSLVGSDISLQRASPGEFAGNIKRPKYSVLENRHLKDLQLNIMPHWKKGLEAYIKK